MKNKIGFIKILARNSFFVLLGVGFVIIVFFGMSFLLEKYGRNVVFIFPIIMLISWLICISYGQYLDKFKK
jgi:hypothetical protein